MQRVFNYNSTYSFCNKGHVPEFGVSNISFPIPCKTYLNILLQENKILIRSKHQLLNPPFVLLTC